MKGDFSRLLVNETYIMTLMQQGRVQLDSDWNTQAVQYYMYLKTVLDVTIGEHGGPKGETDANGVLIDGPFKIGAVSEGDFAIGQGDYFVRGEMCRNQSEDPRSYMSQPYLKDPPDLAEIQKQGEFLLVYLKVWLRHVTHLEDPLIREVALGGPDTTTRVQRVWQVLAAAVDLPSDYTSGEDWALKLKQEYTVFMDSLPDPDKLSSGTLSAIVDRMSESEDPCVLPPSAGYRGMENQLYRVEILYPGSAYTEGKDNKPNPAGNTPPSGKAVYVWSRDNGSVVYPLVDKATANVVTLEKAWRDDRYAVQVGDWVEISDEVSVLERVSRPLCQVTAVDTESMQVTLDINPWDNTRDFDELPLMNPTLRRWDHAGKREWGGGLPVEETTADKDTPLALEKGINIRFHANEDQTEQRWYAKNDSWLIPARTATGDIEWPTVEKAGEIIPKICGPMRDGCFYAPLALIGEDEDGEPVNIDLRRYLKTMWE